MEVHDTWCKSMASGVFFSYKQSTKLEHDSITIAVFVDSVPLQVKKSQMLKC